MPLRFLTAGESHGPALSVIVEGLPAGVPIDKAALDRDLVRRMGGYGRGGRMRIESDEVEILGGVRFGRSLGSPIALVIRNRDHASWAEAMATQGDPPGGDELRAVTRPRPGHADLAGAQKYGTHDARDILERASARETAARTAAGGLAKALLREIGAVVTSRTVAVGRVTAPDAEGEDVDALLALPDDAPMRSPSTETVASMIAEVDAARRAGDSVGGCFEVIARGVPPGLGSHVHWDRRIEARLGGAILSIQAVKAVSIGAGLEVAAGTGREAHDPIGYDARTRRFTRASNRAGGIEGGMTNGEIVRLRGYLKPLATLPRPLPSVDLVTKEAFTADVERTDTVPIVAAGVVGEAMAALVLADALLEKFGGDALTETRANVDAFLERLRGY
ncbi:MAG TPA: chorismate synthase [Candidatus Polarisedimenticolaceae bacterium]|nr:chorismate synthase [Candidatus Polarisedimenticolaceae bacterium]